MRFFRFYMGNSFERVVGIIQARNVTEAKKLFRETYPDWRDWDTEVKEVKFENGICELYYGG